MFTGIIEEVGSLEAIEPRATGSRLRIAAPTVCSDLREGDSVSVNGVCLTAVELRPGSFGADVSPETLRRSNLGDMHTGDLLNLERPLTPQSRLGGHIVQGHVDGVGELISLEQLGDDNWWLRIRVPSELGRYLVFKGSVALDGISLTLAEVEGDAISVTIIPHTFRNTNLHLRRPGDRINVECDVLAKYVEKMMASLDVKPKLTMERLLEQGF